MAKVREQQSGQSAQIREKIVLNTGMEGLDSDKKGGLT